MLNIITKIALWLKNKRQKVYIILAVYILSYIFLSRYGIAIAKYYTISGFYYLPVYPGIIIDSPVLTTIHYVLLVLYYPIYIIDHLLFNIIPCVLSMPSTTFTK